MTVSEELDQVIESYKWQMDYVLDIERRPDLAEVRKMIPGFKTAMKNTLESLQQIQKEIGGSL